MMIVSDQKLSPHIERENVEFLMSPEGGSLTVESVAKRLGVGLPGLQKRMIQWRREARQR